MAKFIYNNAKNANIGHISFEHNCNYYLHIFFLDYINPWSRSCSANKQIEKHINMMNIC